MQILRSRGVLIIGSGNTVHNLSLVDFQNFNKDNYGYDWAIEANEIINNSVLNRDFKTLIDFQKWTKAFQLAIPTLEHYLPLLYTLGVQQDSNNPTIFNNKLLA